MRNLLQSHLRLRGQSSRLELREDNELLYLVCTNPGEQILCPGREGYTAATSVFRLPTDKEVAEYFPIRGVQFWIQHTPAPQKAAHAPRRETRPREDQTHAAFP